MRIDGNWKLCEDGGVRPVFVARLLSQNGAWFQATFLADTGADRTVLSEDIFRELGLPAMEAVNPLSGLGGTADSVMIATTLQLKQQDGISVEIKGQFAAVTDAAALDMSLLGRDITNLFALIVDRPQDVVCLLGQRHRYQIMQD